MKKWWLSWYNAGSFTLERPWWITGYRGEVEPIFCAAVIAPSEDEAKAQIVRAHDDDREIEWRFCDEKAWDWEPFSDRFPWAYWMRWEG